MTLQMPSETYVISFILVNSSDAFFYVVRTVHFGMKLYNDQRNAQVFNIFINLLQPYMFQAFF
jgi:hypothetical protein